MEEGLGTMTTHMGTQESNTNRELEPRLESSKCTLHYNVHICVCVCVWLSKEKRRSRLRFYKCKLQVHLKRSSLTPKVD